MFCLPIPTLISIFDIKIYQLTCAIFTVLIFLWFFWNLPNDLCKNLNATNAVFLISGQIWFKNIFSVIIKLLFSILLKWFVNVSLRVESIFNSDGAVPYYIYYKLSEWICFLFFFAFGWKFKSFLVTTKSRQHWVQFSINSLMHCNFELAVQIDSIPNQSA